MFHFHFQKKQDLPLKKLVTVVDKAFTAWFQKQSFHDNPLILVYDNYVNFKSLNGFILTEIR